MAWSRWRYRHQFRARHCHARRRATDLSPELQLYRASDNYRQAGRARGFASLRAAFPGLHYTVEDMVAEGDKVVVRFTSRGTHHGAFRGIPPTGKAIAYTGILIWRFVEGKIAEHWAVPDLLGLLQQLSG